MQLLHAGVRVHVLRRRYASNAVGNGFPPLPYLKDVVGNSVSGVLAPVLDKSRDFSMGWQSTVNSRPRQCHHNRLHTAGVRLRRQAEDYGHFSGPYLNALNNGADNFAFGRPIRIAQVRLEVIGECA